MSADLSPAIRGFVAALALTALGLAAVQLLGNGVEASPRDLALAASLTGVLAVAHRRPLAFAGHTQLLLDTAVLLAAVLLLDPGFAVLAAGLGPLLANLPRREPWPQAAFNAGQSALQAAAGSAALTVGGWWHRGDPFADPSFLPAVLLAGGAMFLVNTAAVAAIVALQTGRPFRSAWPDVARLDRTEAVAHLAQLGLGLLAAVVADAHLWALILLALPGAVVYSALGHHVRLRLAAEAKLVHLAYHDALTDLPNRALLVERLTEALERPDPLAVLYLDLDDFKPVNDALGHEAGDRLLVEVADRLRNSAPEGATVARLAGDEFVVLLPDPTGPGEPSRVAKKIQATLAAPLELVGWDRPITASIGAVRRTAAHAAPADLLRDADAALYRAKRTGKARYALYNPEPQGSGQALAGPPRLTDHPPHPDRLVAPLGTA